MNLHNHIHRAHYARHVVAIFQRSLSPPHSPAQQLPRIGDSPSRASAKAAARAASGAAASTAERPLPEQTHRHALQAAAAEPRHTDAEAAPKVPRVKRQLLNGMHMDHPSVGPSVANSHPYTVPELSSSAGPHHSSSQHQALHSNTVSGTTQPEESAAAVMNGLLLPAAVTAADPERLSVPAENGNQETGQQQQELTAQMNGTARQQAGSGSAKAFLSGIRPDPAPWDDVDPVLAKERAALNRYTWHFVYEKELALGRLLGFARVSVLCLVSRAFGLKGLWNTSVAIALLVTPVWLMAGTTVL